MPRRLVASLAIVAMPATALAVVLVVQATIAGRREYLPLDPGYTVDFTALPDGGTDSTAAEPLRLAVLGDSLVAGMGADSERDSLAGQVATKVADATTRPVVVRGYGVSGADTADVTRSQVPMLAGEQYDAVVVEVGSNDVLHGTPPWKVDELTREMLSRVREQQPDAVIVLGSAGRMDTPNFDQPLRAVIVRYATLVRGAQRQAARAEGVRFMDVSQDVSPTFSNTPGTTSSDEFHPSERGYEIWARPLAELVVDGLREQDRVVGS